MREYLFLVFHVCMCIRSDSFAFSQSLCSLADGKLYEDKSKIFEKKSEKAPANQMGLRAYGTTTGTLCFDRRSAGRAFFRSTVRAVSEKQLLDFLLKSTNLS